MTETQNKIDEYPGARVGRPFGVDPPSAIRGNPDNATQDAADEANGDYLPYVHSTGRPLKTLQERVAELPALPSATATLPRRGLRTWHVRLEDGEKVTYKAHEHALGEKGEALFLINPGQPDEFLSGSIAADVWLWVRYAGIETS